MLTIQCFMLTRQLIWGLTDKLSFWFCCFLRDVTLYEHVCTRMCSLVASTPAVCFSAVVSSANRNTGLITCLKCQDIENHVVICFKNGSVLTMTDQLIAIPLRQYTFTTLFELRELKCSQVVNIHAMVFFISFELFSSKIFLFLASIFLYFHAMIYLS